MWPYTQHFFSSFCFVFICWKMTLMIVGIEPCMGWCGCIFVAQKVKTPEIYNQNQAQRSRVALLRYRDWSCSVCSNSWISCLRYSWGSWNSLDLCLSCFVCVCGGGCGDYLIYCVVVVGCDLLVAAVVHKIFPCVGGLWVATLSETFHSEPHADGPADLQTTVRRFSPLCCQNRRVFPQ